MSVVIRKFRKNWRDERIFFLLWRYSPYLGLGLPPWNSPFHFGLLDLRRSVGPLGRVVSSSQGLYLYTNTQTQKNAQTQTPNIHALSAIRTHDHGFRASEDSTRLRPLGYRDRPWEDYIQIYLNDSISWIELTEYGAQFWAFLCMVELRILLSVGSQQVSQFANYLQMYEGSLAKFCVFLAPFQIILR
jgi:hypothetical protein